MSGLDASGVSPFARVVQNSPTLLACILKVACGTWSLHNFMVNLFCLQMRAEVHGFSNELST